MLNKNVLAAALALVLCAASHAQTPTCTCDSNAARTLNQTALATLLGNKMVCANVGSEVWQELHNGGAAGLSGPLVDYKLGPSDPKDPSSTVGSFTVNADNTVTYIYSGGGRFTYDVCLAATGYTFCGANYGGRNITGARIGGNGLTACSGVTNSGGSITRSR